MLARILDNQTIQFEQITTPEEFLLKKHFSVKHPRARFIDTSSGCNFDGVYYKYREKTRTLSRAFLGDLRRFCAEQHLPLTVMDDRPPPAYPAPDPSLVTPDFLATESREFKLEDYQIRSIRATCTAEVGLIEAPTGAGKGEIIAAITKLHNCPTVIIAEQTVVIEELKERLEIREVASDIGVFMAGKRPNGQLVIVGMIQSLSAPTVPPQKTQKDTPVTFARKLQAFQTRLKNARILRAMISKCELLLIDEADRAVNKQYRQLIRHYFKGRRRYGLSGTFFDPAKPVENMNLRENLGSVIASTTRAEVQSRGRIIPVTYTAIAFGDQKKRHDKTAFDLAEKEWIEDNPKFLMLIKALAEKSRADPTHGTVVLCENVNLGIKLAEAIDSELNPTFIYGKTTKKARRAAITAFQKRECRVLVGSKIIRRGMDLKGGCETLIIATAGKLWSEFNQMVGRSVRINSKMMCQVYDIFHLNNHYLYLHSRMRLKHIIGMGYDARVVFPGHTINAADFVKSRFKMPPSRSRHISEIGTNIK